MRGFLRARDQHCRFPGCRMPVHRGETEHALEHPDVPDEFRWTARQLRDWTLERTGAAGRIHLDKPPRRVMLAPSDVPPPPSPDDWAVHVEAPSWENGQA